MRASSDPSSHSTLQHTGLHPPGRVTSATSDRTWSGGAATQVVAAAVGSVTVCMVMELLRSGRSASVLLLGDGLRQLRLVHLGAASHVQLPGPVHELVLGV